MRTHTSNVLNGAAKSHNVDGASLLGLLARGFMSLVTDLSILAKYQTCMIGKIESVDTIAQTATVIDLKTNRKMRIIYKKCFESVLLSKTSDLIEIVGRIRVDGDHNPLTVRYINRIVSVDTSEIKVSEILPDYLQLRANKDPSIKVALDETKRFYCGDLESLNIFACGDSRENLKERLTERLEVCWEASVREDCADFSINAMSIRKKLVSTFVEG